METAVHRMEAVKKIKSFKVTFREASFMRRTCLLDWAYRYPRSSKASTVVRERLAVFSISG